MWQVFRKSGEAGIFKHLWVALYTTFKKKKKKFGYYGLQKTKGNNKFKIWEFNTNLFSLLSST